MQRIEILKIFFRLSKRGSVILIKNYNFYKIVLDKRNKRVYTVYIDMHSICTEWE